MWDYGDNDDEKESESPAYPSVDSTLRSLIGAFFEEDRSLFNLESRSLRPLFKVEESADSVIVTFDLPRVEKGKIVLSSTENTLNVEASMTKPVTLRVGSSTQRRLAFEKYSAHVQLPRPVDPEKGVATFKNGLLRVRFPVAKKGSRVKIR